MVGQSFCLGFFSDRYFYDQQLCSYSALQNLDCFKVIVIEFTSLLTPNYNG